MYYGYILDSESLIIMGVTGLLLLGPFYTIQTKKDQTFLRGVYMIFTQDLASKCSHFVIAFQNGFEMVEIKFLMKKVLRIIGNPIALPLVK